MSTSETRYWEARHADMSAVPLPRAECIRSAQQRSSRGSKDESREFQAEREDEYDWWFGEGHHIRPSLDEVRSQ